MSLIVDVFMCRKDNYGYLIHDAATGKTAAIDSIEEDYEGRIYVAVVLEDDPGREIGELKLPAHRFFFSSEELEPLEEKIDV